MGKWGCRGIPPGRQPFHHPLRMTADLKALTHSHTHTYTPGSCLPWTYYIDGGRLLSVKYDTLTSGEYCVSVIDFCVLS